MLLEVLKVILTFAKLLPHILWKLLDDDINVLPERVFVSQGVRYLLYPLSGCGRKEKGNSDDSSGEGE